jgi:hypothetical protein
MFAMFVVLLFDVFLLWFLYFIVSKFARFATGWTKEHPEGSMMIARTLLSLFKKWFV